MNNTVTLGGVNLHQSADRARAAANWPADIYYRRLICERKPEDSGGWVQYGHALKEAGFHDRARLAYERALVLDPGDAEIALQLGHLAKVQGDFKMASDRFSQARELGYANSAELDFELGLLKRIDNSLVFSEAPRGADREGVKVYLSVPGGRISEGDKAAVGSGLGVADYSYSFAMRGFLQALEDLEIDHTVIEHPEYVSDIRERSSAKVNIHLCFYPPERLRLLKGAYNINCLAWEFDRLRSSSELLTYHAFADQATMLNVPDELWAPSHSAVAAIQASGVTKPVKMVTSPILENIARKARTGLPSWSDIDRLSTKLKTVPWQPLAIVPRIQPAMNSASWSRRRNLRSILRASEGERPPPVFLTIFNVHDFRKQLRPALEAFVQFSHERPDAVLLLKMSTPFRGEPVNSLLHGEQITNPGELAAPLVSDRIWITDQVLTREDLTALLDVSAYYLCTAHGEGQNLPLIEAMGRGLVPVSVDHTAMADYIRPDNAVILTSREDVFTQRLSGRYGLFGAKTFYTSADEVRDGLARAVALSETDYAAKSSAAIAVVREQFGVTPFSGAFQDVVARLSDTSEESSSHA